VIGPEWLPAVLDALVVLTLVAAAIGGLFYGVVRVTTLLADGFEALTRQMSRPRDSTAEDPPTTTEAVPDRS